MPTINKVTFLGNLTRDPELRYTPSGVPVVQFGLASNRRWKDRNTGEVKEEVCFVDVEMWNKQAETANEMLKKGKPCIVEGRLKLDQWEKDGQKRTKLKISAEKFVAFEPIKKAEEDGDPSEPQF
jgi:single-strand DNA-binding protein